MYNRLITLGCSVTQHVGWAKSLADSMKISLINLAQSSGSNALQQFRFQELIFSDNITSNDIIIWQVTGTERSYLRKPANPAFLKQKKIENKNTSHARAIIHSTNIFDKKERIDFLSHSNFSQRYNYGDILDLEQNFEDLLFYIISAKKMTPNVFVVYGWRSVVSENYKSIFEEQLSKHNIKMFKEPIVDWCIKNKLKLLDDSHPKQEAYQEYCNNYMYPQLKEFLDIKKI